MSFLACAGLTKTYADGTRAVRGIDLRCGAGEFAVLLGPSGCGKTTTLRMVAGLEKPTAGQIVLAGVDITGHSPAERDVGFAFQFYALYPHLKVEDNIGFPLESMGLSRGERRQRVADIVERLGLGALVGRYPRQLAGGDQQRVALARAMVRRPQLYLMDEPLGTLDADLRLEMREMIRAQQLDAGITTLYVTHDQAEALSMGDSIAVLAEGRILQQGRPEVIYRRPVSPVVARQLGQPAINILRVERRGDRWIGPNEVERMPALSGAGEMLLGVRPEDIAPTGGRVPGVVRVVEDAGAAWILWVDWAGASIHITASKERRFAPGETVYPRIDPE